METWDLYDENRVPLGVIHKRGAPLPDGAYHIVVNAWIKNSRGQYLVSKRAPSRKMFPGMYECVGGSVLAGEDSITAALREIREEVGLSLTKRDGMPLFTKLRKTENGRRLNSFLDVYLFTYDGEVDLASATTDEVESVTWMTYDELRQAYDEGLLVPTLGYFFEIAT